LINAAEIFIPQRLGMIDCAENGLAGFEMSDVFQGQNLKKTIRSSGAAFFDFYI
jgi:hypothetical protein